MTTPEKIRRRERIIIVGLIVVLVGVIFTSWQDQRADDRAQQREQSAEARDAERERRYQLCLTEQITALTDSLTVRGRLAEADSDITRRVILTVANATSSQNMVGVRTALAQYAIDAAEVKRLRARTTIPPFPTGKCDKFNENSKGGS